MPSRCKLCGLEKDLVKAHCIPEAFFSDLMAGEDHLLLVRPEPYPKRSRLGVYDTSILCPDCERRFQDLDDYGAKVLLSQFPAHFETIINDGRVEAYRSNGHDTDALLRFLVSILWRACVSAQPFYEEVQLNRFEKAALEFSLDQSRSNAKEFDALIWRWENASPLTNVALLPPQRVKLLGLNCYKIGLGRFVAYVKVDQRNFPKTDAWLSLRNFGSLVVLTKEFADSEDMAQARQIIRRAKELQASHRAKHPRRQNRR